MNSNSKINRTVRRQSTPFPRGFNVGELLVVLAIIGGLLYLMFGPPINRDKWPRGERENATALQVIDVALAEYACQYGEAPIEVDDLSVLAGEFIDISDDPNDLITRMVMTGTDSWGNRLIIQPVPEKPGRFTLRSLGPDGLMGADRDSDDQVVSYTGRVIADAPLEPTDDQQQQNGDGGASVRWWCVRV